MNLQTQSLKSTFIAVLIASLCLSMLFPSLRLMYLAPFLITLYYQRPYLDCLWGSLLCGVILDLLSQNHRLGLYAANFCLTTMILYPLRRNFFADTLTTLPIMTYFFSVISTCIQALMTAAFEQKWRISLGWIVTDIGIYPLFDGLYAFIYLTLPASLFGKRQRRGTDYFSNH